MYLKFAAHQNLVFWCKMLHTFLNNSETALRLRGAVFYFNLNANLILKICLSLRDY